ncbi:MAG: kelch repeat-containing protein [Patescibacteria group bacterium]
MLRKTLLVFAFFLIFAYLYPIKNTGYYVATENVATALEVMQFRPERLTWSEVTPSASWQPRDSAVSFVFNDKMWTMGGLNGDKEIQKNNYIPYWEAPHFNDIWTSEDGANWHMATEHAQWPPRRSMSVVSLNNKLFMFGGWSPINAYTSDAWESDDGVTWAQISAKSTWPSREGQTAIAFQGKIWFMGGVNYDERKEKNDVWSSSDGLTWDEVLPEAPWSPRWDHAMTVFKGRIFLSGGMDLSGKTFNDVWVSSDGIHWEEMPTPPWQGRQGHSLVVFHDKLWIIGRLNDKKEGGVNDIWFSDDGVTWQKTNTDPEWIGREDHSVLVWKDRIFVFGGMGSDWQWKNDVWRSN